MLKESEIHLVGKPTDPHKALMGPMTGDMIDETWFIEGLAEARKNPLLPHPLDRIRLSFLVFNVSRALQQQITRHRIDFSFCIQSLRMVDVKNFSERKAYTIPERLGDTDRKLFEMCTGFVEGGYKSMILNGVAVEDARGVLPLSIHSTISFSCTFRALLDMLGQRLCLSTQDEFRKLAFKIKEEVTKWDPLFGLALRCPCDVTGECFMNNETCEKVRTGRTKIRTD
jgi:flavin-dependent thymidylate synthase